MEAIQNKAREVGRLISQTDEFKAVKRANERLSDDRETVSMINKLNELQEELAAKIQRGEEPTEEQQESFESLMQDLQSRSIYQGVVAAQSNFDRLMMRVNEEIGQGIEAGRDSGIILSS